MWNKKLNLQTIGICGFLIYVMLDALIRFFFPVETFKVFFLMLMVAFAACSKMKSIFTFQDCCLICAFPFLLFNNASLEIGSYYGTVSYALILGLFILAKEGEQWFESVIKIIEIFTIVYALFTYIFALLPNFYQENIIPLFSESDQISLRLTSSMGYYSGLTTHYSHNAMFMALGTGLFASRLIVGQNNNKLYSIIGLFLCAIALLLTGKRGHVIFSSVSIIVLYYVYNSDKKQSRLIKLLLIIGIAVALFFILSPYIPGLTNFIKRFQETEESGNVYSGRDHLVELAYELFLTSPILGVGWFRFQYVHIQRYPWFPTRVNTHNVYMQLLCETGIVGFVIYMLFFISNYFECVRLIVGARRKKYELPQKHSLVLAYGLFLQTFFLTYCMTGNPLYDPIISLPYILFSMMMIIISRKYTPSNQFFRKIKFD